MELKDGSTRYRSDPSYWQLTVETEQAAKKVLNLLKKYRDEPIPAALTAAGDLLIQIEKWKAMCLKDRMGNAERNTARAVWDAFQGAVNATHDLEPCGRLCCSKALAPTSMKKQGSGGQNWLLLF